MANTPLSKALRGRPARYLVAALAASLLALGVAAPPPTATPLRQAQTTQALRGAVAAPAAQPLDLTPASLVELQNFTPDEARIWNAAIPASSAPNPAARPFVLSAGALSRARASDCLTAAVYYEATNESLEGLRAPSPRWC